MESMRSWSGLCLRTKSTRIVKEILRRSWLALMIQCSVLSGACGGSDGNVVVEASTNKTPRKRVTNCFLPKHVWSSGVLLLDVWYSSELASNRPTG